MRIFSVIVCAQNPSDSKPYLYSREYDVESFGFFVRGKVKESFKFLARESVMGLQKGTRHTVTHETQYMVHIQVSYKQQLAVYAFCDSSYPRRIAYRMLTDVLEKFESEAGSVFPKLLKDENIDIGLGITMKNYQDPKKFDAVLSALDKADKIQIVLHENIKMLLERGESLDVLVGKSKDLSMQSKQFYKSSKKMDKSCCTVF